MRERESKERIQFHLYNPRSYDSDGTPAFIPTLLYIIIQAVSFLYIINLHFLDVSIHFKKHFQLKLSIVLLHMLLWLFCFNSQNISGLIVHIKKLKTHYIWVLSNWNTENWVPSTHSSYSFDNGPTGLLLESKCVCNHLCTNY